MLTRLIQGEGPDDQLSEVELLQNCVFILNAGHETTTNLIGNALVTLTQWPAQRAALQAMVSDGSMPVQALDLAVDEFLRFESSNQLGNRRAVEAFELDGRHWPAGTLITLCIGAANRDPAVFAEPDQLDLGRLDNRHLAFGFGVHQCAGLSLARLEGRIALGRFVRRFPHYALQGAPVRGGRARFRGFLGAPFSTG